MTGNELVEALRTCRKLEEIWVKFVKPCSKEQCRICRENEGDEADEADGGDKPTKKTFPLEPYSATGSNI